jgi:SAM-dependent methyltransferase
MVGVQSDGSAAYDGGTAYDDPTTAWLYDRLNPWGASDAFYLDLIHRAASALDVGCGTGTLLARARVEGHRGDLVGVDPAAAMLDVARSKRPDVEWLRGDAQTLDLRRTFDLVTMTGHAFQLLREDAAVRAALAAFRRHLRPGGVLAFETRNPAARPWERWTPDATRVTVRLPTGAMVEIWNDVVGLRQPDLVDLVEVYHPLDGEPTTTQDTLRFIDGDRLRALLTEAGFRVDGWYGDWDRSPVTPTSPEIIVVATC